MPRIMIAMLAFAAGLMAAAPAWAQDGYQPRLSFEIGGERYSLAPPKGYCRATGDLEAEFQRYNSIAQFPLLFVLVPCDPNRASADYILVKHAPSDKRDRKALLAALGAELPRFDAAEENKAIVDSVGSALEKLIGGKVDMTLDIRPLGVDDVCAYMAGNVRFDRGGDPIVISALICATAIGNHPMMLMRYLPAAETGRVKELPGEVRAMGISLRAE